MKMKNRKDYLVPFTTTATVAGTLMQQTSWTPGEGNLPVTPENPKGEEGEDIGYGGHEEAKKNTLWDDTEF